MCSVTVSCGERAHGHHDVDAGEIEVLLAQWPEAGIEVGAPRVELGRSGLGQPDPRLP
jgi:hypothetical protein